MMSKTRRRVDASLTAKIALEALREQFTIADFVQRYECTRTRSMRGRSTSGARGAGV